MIFESCCLTTCSVLIGALLGIIGLLYIVSLRKKYSIKGKHVLITGGSSGIGKAVALEALKRGAIKVTLVARNKAKLHSVKEELVSIYGQQSVSILSGDVSNLNEIESTIKEYLSDASNSPVDVIINSAGITHTSEFLETENDIFQSLYSTNVLGGIAVTKAVLPSMKDRKTGHIVFISSQAGQFPMYGYTAYASAKFALRGLAEVLAMELLPYNIRVSISFPPDTETPQLEDELKHRTLLVKELASYSSIPLKPEQVASEILSGVERQQYSIHHGFDGFMLKTVTAGAAPFSSLIELLTQVLFIGIFRLVALGYLFQFNRIVSRCLKKNN